MQFPLWNGNDPHTAQEHNMVQAIDLSSSASGAPAISLASISTMSAPAAGALQAQLEQYQRQLSDCVNCSSASTPEGKQEIVEISRKISGLKHVIEASHSKAASASPLPQVEQTTLAEKAPSTLPHPGFHATGVNSVHQGFQSVHNQYSSDAAKPVVAANLTLGVNVDVYS